MLTVTTGPTLVASFDIERRTVICTAFGAVGREQVSTAHDLVDAFVAVRGLILDLRATTFVDTAGLQGLVALVRHVRASGTPVEVLPPEGPAGTALRAAGFDRAVGLEPGLDAAGGATPPP